MSHSGQPRSIGVGAFTSVCPARRLEWWVRGMDFPDCWCAAPLSHYIVSSVTVARETKVSLSHHTIRQQGVASARNNNLRYVKMLCWIRDFNIQNILEVQTFRCKMISAGKQTHETELRSNLSACRSLVT